MSVVKVVKFNNAGSPTRNDLVELNKPSKATQIINCMKDVILMIKEFGTFGGNISIISYMLRLEEFSCRASQKDEMLVVDAVVTTFKRCKTLFEKSMLTSQNKFQEFSSFKVKLLIEILKDFKKITKKPFLGIIFVERRSTAKVLCHILKEAQKFDPDLDFIKPEFIVGFSSAPTANRLSLYAMKNHRRIIDSFIHEDINLLIATTVIEEGVDIPQCTFVCKFDRPLNYRSYIQSKGRARSKESFYYIMVPSDDAQNFMRNYEKFQNIESLLSRVSKDIKIFEIKQQTLFFEGINGNYCSKTKSNSK